MQNGDDEVQAFHDGKNDSFFDSITESIEEVVVSGGMCTSFYCFIVFLFLFIYV